MILINYFITSLRNYKICKAYVGVYHSLSQTQEGKVFACGNNKFSRFLLKNGLREGKIYEPIETSSTNDSLYITGNYSTVIFKNHKPPMSPNEQVDLAKLIPINKIQKLRMN